MSIYHGIRAARKALNRKANNPLRISAVTGNGEGTVETGTANLIYCVTAEEGVVQAWAYSCPHVYGLPVWLTQSERRPGALEVVSVRDIGSQNSSQQAEVGKHGDSHRWLGLRGGGYDPTFIELRQFVPFGLWSGNDPETAFLLRVGRGVVWTGVQWAAVQPSTLDLTAHLPTSVGAARYARYVLIYLASKDAGTAAEVKGLAGTAVVAANLTLEDIPAPPTNVLMVIGAVRMYSDQEMIQDGRTSTDIIDMRFPMRSLVDASDVLAGTISTDRFSAYDDLVAETKIGPGSAQVAAGTHAHTFPQLTDVPSSYAGQSGKMVTVKADESGLEFVSKGLTRDTYAVATGASNPHYDLSSPTSGIDLGVYYNGVRVLDADFSIDGDGGGFTLAFDVFAGDYVMAEQLTSGAQIIAPLNPVEYPVTRSYTSNKLDGIFGYIATRGGVTSWVNPATSTAWVPQYYTPSQISVWYGQTGERATDGSLLTGVHTDNSVNAWWKADFGAGHALTMTYFGIVGRPTDGLHLRNFNIQGSNDDGAWTDLLVVVNDGPGDGTWFSAAVTGAGAYRWIRVYETDTNTGGSWYMTFNELEFWGTLT